MNKSIYLLLRCIFVVVTFLQTLLHSYKLDYKMKLLFGIEKKIEVKEKNKKKSANKSNRHYKSMKSKQQFLIKIFYSFLVCMFFILTRLQWATTINLTNYKHLMMPAWKEERPVTFFFCISFFKLKKNKKEMHDIVWFFPCSCPR